MHHIRRHGRLLSVCALILATQLVGCDFGTNLSKAVIIEYDQSLNFFSYGLGSNHEWPPSVEVAPIVGVFLLYQVCAVQNNAPKAVPFTFITKNFYVGFGKNGKSFAESFPTTAIYLPEIQQKFIQETQTSPDQQVIAANSDNTLSVSWRFVIFYPSQGVSDDEDTLKTVQPDLQYDAAGVVTHGRGYPTVGFGGYDVLAQENLPLDCRPKQA
jgi:hypothetical protein